jgi:enoyl-CoA hydratase/carnithine racemase
VSDLKVDLLADADADADADAGSGRPPGPLRVRLDAPARRNALTLSTVEHLHHVLEEEPARTLVLGSATPGIFSAGADLDVDDATRARLSDLLYACYELMVTRPGIVIAVVEGAAVGGGAQLTTAADLRIASPVARWRWVGPGHGLAVGSWILPSLVGRARALDLTLTSRWLNADEAVTAGLVTRLDGGPWQAAVELARRLGDADAAALSRVKQVATTGPLLDRLRAEREENRTSWSGAAPQAHVPARQGLDRSDRRGI